MKFKEGDKVRVKSNSRLDGGKFAGKTGIVECVDRGTPYPYEVEFEDGLMIFKTNELIKVEECDGASSK